MNIAFRLKIIIVFLLFFSLAGLFADNVISLTLGGTDIAYRYTSELLTSALNSEGYEVQISYAGNLPTTRLEYMMANGSLSCFILGKTEIRSEKFLKIDIGMTNNLMGQRILFIRPEMQIDFDTVYTLDDFRALEKIAGMGIAWGDVDIWEKNNLLVETVVGDWKKLFNMVSSGKRNIDYLSRGAQEIIQEYEQYRDLVVEKNLVLVYPRDHILYVSPKNPELHRILTQVMSRAEETGLIEQVSRDFFAEVYDPPVNLDERRIIHLELPD